MSDDRTVLRALVEEYLEATQCSQNDQKRELWRRLNSLDSVRPMIVFNFGRVRLELPDLKVRECGDPVLSQTERWLREKLFLVRVGDDSVFEPWLPLRASFRSTGWGLHGHRNSRPETGAWTEEHPIRDISDLSGLRTVHHEIDEEATAERLEKLQDAVGDLIEVDLDRSPIYQIWEGDLSTSLGHLRGIQESMMDMYDSPDELHALLAFMRDGVLRTHDEAEAANDWGLSAHQNQSMVYANELRDPAPNSRGVKREDLWCYMAAQELTLVSPEMHDQFMLQYQLPILKTFGLVAYGCCEDLTNKIDMLRQIPNLRRIAVAPLANVEKCGEQIGTDYVISYRPNPADMVCVGFDESRIRKILGHALEVFRGQHVEINLKDVQTVQNEPHRIREWARIAREVVADHCAG
jgi:hypothetical protein